MKRRQSETEISAAEAIIGDNVDPITVEQCEKLGISYHNPILQAVGIDLRAYDSPADVPSERRRSLREDILGALGLLDLTEERAPKLTINHVRTSNSRCTNGDEWTVETTGYRENGARFCIPCRERENQRRAREAAVRKATKAARRNEARRMQRKRAASEREEGVA